MLDPRLTAPFRFTLAHLSDPHVGPLPSPRLGQLLGKRMTGYINWQRGRRLIHDMAMLDRLMDDILAAKPDHVALTGDLVNLGLPQEFAPAAQHLARLGSAEHVSIVPGNHDAYVRGSMPAMLASFSAHMSGDDLDRPSFPYMRIRGRVALIGVSSAIPTAPFLASGAVGPAQRQRLAAMLEASGTAGFARVVMIHHAPVPGSRFGRGLRDHVEVADTIAEKGAELVLHGHNHRQEVRSIASVRGPVPVVGVASASAVPGTHSHKAAWHLITLELDETSFRIAMTTRGSGPGSAFTDVNRHILLEAALATA